MEAEARNEEYCPNLGLHDQRLALQWVGCSAGPCDPCLLKIAIRCKTTSHISVEIPRRSLLPANPQERGRL